MRNEQIVEIYYEGRQKAFWPDAMARNSKAGLFFEINSNNITDLKSWYIRKYIKVGFLRGIVTQHSHQLHQGNINNTADMRVFS